MLYESVRDSAAFFKKQKKARQTYQEKMIFRWKFVAIGLGVLLLILVGICSELIKQLSQRKQIFINTTFLSAILPHSQILSGSASIGPLRYLTAALRQAYDIRYDNSSEIFRGYHTSGQSISKLIKQHRHLLVLLQLSEIQNGSEVSHKFGMYLHAYFPDIDYTNNSNIVNTTDERDELKSMLFSLESNHSIRLDQSEQCFIYQYNTPFKVLSLAELVHFSQNTVNSQVSLIVNNYFCFNKNGDQSKESINQDLKKVIGFEVHGKDEAQQTILILKHMEIYELQMTFGGVASIIDQNMQKVKREHLLASKLNLFKMR